MNLDQNVRWQHVVLIAAVVGVLSGGMIFAIGLTGSGTDGAAPMGFGACVLVGSALIGALAFASLRGSLTRAAGAERLARGPFDLTGSAPEPLARLNSRLASHFGISPAADRPPMSATFGQFVDAVAEWVQTQAATQPSQLEAARSALAAVVGTQPQAIPWSSNPTRIIPPGRKRFHNWQRLRAAAPQVPEAKLNPWVENVAIYGLLAALIAIAVPIAQRMDSNEATRVTPSPGDRVVGKAFGLLLFGSVIGVLMIPVYVIGRRYAARLPEEIGDMGTLARYFPQRRDAPDDWTAAMVAEHLRDLVSMELGIPASSLRDDTPLRPSPHLR